MSDCGIDFAQRRPLPLYCGVVIGSGIGGIETIEEQNKILVARGVSRVSPFTVPRLMANAGSGNVSILYHLNGPNTTVATACDGFARHRRCRVSFSTNWRRWVRRQRKLAPSPELGIRRFCARPRAFRPAMMISNVQPAWDKDRDGFVMTEDRGSS